MDIHLRRARLQARIEAQRVALGVIATRWEKPLAVADAGIGAVRFVKRHPFSVIGIASLVVLRWRGVSGLINTGWSVWNLYRGALSGGRKALSGWFS
jgi:hypothetical protein